VTFAQPITFDRVMTMERLNDGQHVEEYSVEVLVNGGWKQVAHAYALGHKKIDIFDPVTARSCDAN
jgi:alpha-L-fucosidase